MRQTYNANFYDGQFETSYRSASRVLDILLPVIDVDSMIDFGCGRGTWLKAAEEKGVEKLVGIDGPWSDESKFLPQTAQLVRHNLEDPLSLDSRFSLAMSVEVAEHLTPPAAATLIDNMCASSDVVLFGAATNFQGGKHHINEHRASEWVELFTRKDYACLDVVRKIIWDQDDIGVAYRQNLFIFVNQSRPELIQSIVDRLPQADMPIDVIHPDLFEQHMANVYFPNLRFTLGRIYRFMKYSVLRVSKDRDIATTGPQKNA